MRYAYLMAGIVILLQAGIACPAGAATLSLGNHAIHVAVHNRAAALAVENFEIASSFEGAAAPPGHVYVILDVRWKNI
ncbi:MAG: hypothetical protein ACRESR_11220, partial [Gammaproteobacteria bacterium]